MFIESVPQVTADGSAFRALTSPGLVARLRKATLRRHSTAQLAARFEIQPRGEERLSPAALRLLDAASSPWIWLGIGLCTYCVFR